MTIKYHYTLHPLSPEDGGGYLREFSNFSGVAGDRSAKEEVGTDGHKALKAALATLKQLMPRR